MEPRLFDKKNKIVFFKNQKPIQSICHSCCDEFNKISMSDDICDKCSLFFNNLKNIKSVHAPTKNSWLKCDECNTW